MRKPTDPDARICYRPKIVSGVYRPGIRELSFEFEKAQALQALAVRALDHIV